MQITIKFEGVIDHLDVLSEENNKASRLIDSLYLALNEIPVEESGIEERIKSIIEQVQKLQKNISGRRDLLLEIVDVLKMVSIKTDNIVTEIGYEIDKLSDGGRNE